MRTLTYVSAIISFLLMVIQVAIVLTVWLGTKENRMNLMAVPMLAPFVFITAAATLAFARNIKTSENERDAKGVRPVMLQRFAVALMIAQALLFAAG